MASGRDVDMFFPRAQVPLAVRGVLRHSSGRSFRNILLAVSIPGLWGASDWPLSR